MRIYLFVFFDCLTFSLLTLGFHVIPNYVTADVSVVVQRLSLSAWAVAVVVYCPPPHCVPAATAGNVFLLTVFDMTLVQCRHVSSRFSSYFLCSNVSTGKHNTEATRTCPPLLRAPTPLHSTRDGIVLSALYVETWESTWKDDLSRLEALGSGRVVFIWGPSWISVGSFVIFQVNLFYMNIIFVIIFHVRSV